MARIELRVFVAHERSEHLFSAGAQVVAVDGQVAAGRTVIRREQREQRACGTLFSGKGVGQVIVRVAGTHHGMIHVCAGDLQPGNEIGVLRQACRQVCPRSCSFFGGGGGRFDFACYPRRAGCFRHCRHRKQVWREQRSGAAGVQRGGRGPRRYRGGSMLEGNAPLVVFRGVPLHPQALLQHAGSG